MTLGAGRRVIACWNEIDREVFRTQLNRSAPRTRAQTCGLWPLSGSHLRCGLDSPVAAFPAHLLDPLSASSVPGAGREEAGIHAETRVATVPILGRTIPVPGTASRPDAGSRTRGGRSWFRERNQKPRPCLHSVPDTADRPGPSPNHVAALASRWLELSAGAAPHRFVERSFRAHAPGRRCAKSQVCHVVSLKKSGGTR